MAAPPPATGQIVSGARTISVEEVRARGLRAASGLSRLGVGAGDRVALVLRNDFAFFEATIAAGALGAYAVPVNWHFKASEAGYVFRDCGAKAVVVHADLLPAIASALPPSVAVFTVRTPPEVARAYGLDPAACTVPAGVEDWERWLSGFEPWSQPSEAFTPAMLYTSGTTGNPKGVLRPPIADAEQLESFARMRATVFGNRDGMRTVMTGPLYHAAPNAYAIGALPIAELMVLQPRFDPEGLLRLIDERRITHVHLVPTMLIRLLRLPEAVRRRYDYSSLEFVVHAAAPCPPEVKRAMIEWWGPVINEYYGGTESGAALFCDSAAWLAHPGTVGKPIEGATLRICDDAGQALGPGEVGEVYLRLEALKDFTYHGREAGRLAVERDGLITLGDVGYVDEDGYLYLCDRKRDMVISGGVNIYPAEIEAALVAMPGVHDCAVFGVPDAEFGEALLAAVEPEPAARLTEAEIRAWLGARLADYKVPKQVVFHEALPREDSGKIYKRLLREPYWRDAGRRI